MKTLKKTLSVMLAVLMIFSTFSFVIANAEDETVYYTVTYLDWDGSVLSTEVVAAGGIAKAPKNPERASTEEYDYIFKGWDCGDGVLYHATTLPRIASDMTFTATYSEQKVKPGLTLMRLIRDIFARINVIFEYFFRIFNRPGNDEGYTFVTP